MKSVWLLLAISNADIRHGEQYQVCGGSNSRHMSITTKPGVFLDGSCIYDFPSPRGVLSEISKTGLKDLTITRCEKNCKGL